MTALYIAGSRTLKEYPGQDVERWYSISKVIGPNLSLVDRTGCIDMPFNFEIWPEFKMPTLSNVNFNMTYEDCCNERARYILDKSKILNKPITILYSGGIDSTLVLISFMKNLDQKDWRNNIIVALSPDSIVENPNFYYRHIRNNFNIISSDNIGSLLDNTSIIVGGEHNDQLFGSDIIGNIYREYDFDKIHHPYSREFITKWFVNEEMPYEYANVWFDLLDKQIKTKAECEVKSNYQFFWWYNFCFKWQNVFFRMLTVVDDNKKHLITQDFVNNSYYHFYSSKSFQLWSMSNSDKKIMENWDSYKIESKKVIYDYNKDLDYFENKVKIGSLYKLFSQRDRVSAIDTNLNFIGLKHLDPSKYYNKDNSFQMLS
jgi:hypothetical protein